MTPLSIAVLSLSMSADAFAAAIGRGAAHRPTLPQALRAGLVFGVIEAVTPVIGWSLGLAASGFVEAVDHWIAFGLLALVGARMIFEAVSGGHRDHARVRRTGLLALVATAVGTSIDAAAVGVGLAFIGVNIVVVALAIGATTFVMATLGMIAGRAAGARLGAWAELIGGAALIVLGTKILFDHIGWPF